MMRALLVVVLLGAACGDDAGGGGQPAKPGQPGAAAAAAKPDDKNKLVPRKHVEDEVPCPSPDKASGPTCDPQSPVCEAGLYCLPVAAGNNCEPCPERDSIRHEFRDRDFVAEQSRDPFQSYVIIQPGVGAASEGPKPDKTKECQRQDQLIAMGYSYQDLKLVGIVAQGTQRKVLMMAGNVGQIIKRGDCVGKEKAVVQDIGIGSVTFRIPEDADAKRPATETSVQLDTHPLMSIQAPPSDAPQRPQAPVIAPPTPMPPKNAPPKNAPPQKP